MRKNLIPTLMICFQRFDWDFFKLSGANDQLICPSLSRMTKSFPARIVKKLRSLSLTLKMPKDSTFLVLIDHF